MPSGRRAPFPSAPDLPPELDPPPGRLASRSDWEQIEADVRTESDETVADAELREVVWTGAQLVGRRFTGLSCDDVRFERGDLAGAVFEDCRFTRVVFDGCRLSGAVFAGSVMQDVHFVASVADLAAFRMATLRRTAADDSSLRESDFYAATFADVRLSGCDLTRANAEKVTVERLDLRGSTVDSVRGVASLAGATISADQIAPLGAALIGSLGFRVD